ncbi:low affinity iron permease family protein [Mesorhizobium sp. BR1-1-16]|uniref:low affinity iron permease family protein n=1 Tax=Mesorhizobium sp. BR1-1-16 TaxID=2876653 RepID=UPI001CCCC1F6|nr:low affinity iron permease family protein [Mesorhizobium sp. BR1-1-16]MBZ9936931.1 low affinity iron permease family protein [Mesorhizobium sp. BR1-1-16]
MPLDKLFAQFANKTARATGSPVAFLLCVAGVVLWAGSGPIFGFSETWQLVINTSTTIITFLMVFLIQNTQNRDGAAVQTKLDELIRSSNAEDAFMGIEKLTDEELERLHMRCEDMARRASDAVEKARTARRSRGHAV